MTDYLNHGPRGWLTRISVSITVVLILVAGIALSAVFFALFLVLALVGGIWFWWKTRHLRREVRKRQSEFEADFQRRSQEDFQGSKDFIETEYQVLEQHPAPEEPVVQEAKINRDQSDSH